VTRRVWIWVGLILGLGSIGGLEPTGVSAMQYGGAQPPPPPQAQSPGLTVPGDPLSGGRPGLVPAPVQGDDPGVALPPGAEVLARGPIHEAFAMSIVYNPAPPLVYPKAPPDVIVETPPDQRPDGNDVEWIPGYWAWEDERQDYIWISGLWRDIPPGRQWIPGYWSEATGGYCWTSGFWANAETQGGLDYLPTPPASLENGPNSPCPGDDYAWGPGQWVWRETQYNWQPGYWYQTQSNWVWNPSTYQTTPSGCVYNSGYWDYNLAQRGIAYAPVSFAPPAVGVGVVRRPVVYRPSCVLPVGGLMSSLFVRPNHGHYCFGDYYGASSVNVTAESRYIPWFEFRNNRVGYDPIYSTMACRPNRPANWDRLYREEYHYRVEHPEYRPRPTYAAQQEYFKHHPSYPNDAGFHRDPGYHPDLGYRPGTVHHPVPGPNSYPGHRPGAANGTVATYPNTPGNGGGTSQPSYGGGSGGAVTHPSPTVPGSMASHQLNAGQGGGAYNPAKLVEPFHQWAGNTNHPHSVVPVQADHHAQIAQRQTAMTNFQRQRSEQERLGRQATTNGSSPTQQANRPLFRNQLPRSPIAAATAPRNGSRGPAQVPNHPGNQASYHPQLGAMHHTIPVIHHEQARPSQTHHEEGRPR
jgi:hypothetical protein